MNNKLLLNKDLEIIKSLNDSLLKITKPEKEDFQFYVKNINKLENDSFFIKNISDIDSLSLLKKVFSTIDRNKETFYEYKINIFNCFHSLENLYLLYLDLGIDNENKDFFLVKEQLDSSLINLQKILNKKNENKLYYYIKISLDKKVPYFFLSRRIILLNLLEYGNPYNYTPTILDDEDFEYFILDYKAIKSFDIYTFFEKAKKEDTAIKNVEIYKIDMNNNIYNLKFYIKEEKNENSCLLMPGFNFLDIVHYKNYYDTYIESKNQRYILEKLLNISDKNIQLVSLKKISDREVRIFLPSEIKVDNISKVKDILEEIMVDKNIAEVLYSSNLDFFAIQMLEYLRKKYNIEFGNIFQ